MKIMIFTEGTILMHSAGLGKNREEIVEQVKQKEETVHDYSTYVPVDNSQAKIAKWQTQGAEIIYLTSRRTESEIRNIKNVLKKHSFPEGQLLYRTDQLQNYKDVAEKEIPDVLIEDDCESIGGTVEMTYTHIKPELKEKIKSISIKEFGGINHLPDKIQELRMES